MPRETELHLMILVKASPVLTAELRETMCVAATTLGEERHWVRIHPVPFRDLSDEAKFVKYQEVRLRAIRPRSDRRPESWTPIDGSIQLGEAIDTKYAWSRRRENVEALGESQMCDLIEANRSGSGPTTPSLAVVRPVGKPDLLITQRDKTQLDQWRERARAIAARPSLFDDPAVKKPDFEIIPWRFRYKYRCRGRGCNGHAQTIVDWEAVSLYRNVRTRRNWQDLMRQKLVNEMWGDGRDTVLFVGNMEQRPWNFLVLGIFWPPRQPMQRSLLL